MDVEVACAGQARGVARKTGMTRGLRDSPHPIVNRSGFGAALRVGVEVVDARGDDLHRPTQGPLLRRRLRRPRPAHRQGTTTMAPRRPRPPRRRADGRPHRPRHRRRRARTRRADPPRRVPHRHVAPAQAPPRPRHDRVPLRVVRRPLHQPRHRRRPAPPAARRSPRRPLRPARHHRRPTRHRARPQDRPRGPHDRPRPRSTSPCAASSSTATSPTPTTRPAPAPDHAPSRGPGPPHELADFLGRRAPHRLYPALHLTAHTGMRRGEVVGLKWSDLDRADQAPVDHAAPCRASAGNPSSSASRPAPAAAASTSTTRTIDVLARWRRRLRRDGLPARRRRLDVLQHRRPVPQPRVRQPALRPHRAAHPDLPRIRFHDLRHTHASLLDHGRRARSRSSANASATPTPRSPCTPTSTCSPA